MAQPKLVLDEVVTDEVLRWVGTNIHAFSGLDDPTLVWQAMLRDGPNAIDYYEDIEEKDDAVSGALDQIRESILNCDTKILPASDSAEDKRNADFAIEVFQNISMFDDILNGLLDAAGKGVSIAEIMWAREGTGQRSPVRIAAIKPRPQQIFTFGDLGMPQTGELRLARYRSGNGEPLPERKFLVHSWRPRHGNRWGQPLIRKVFWLSWFKRQGLKLWLKFLEKGTGTLLARYPSGGDQAVKDQALALAKAAAEDTAIAIPDNSVIEVLEKFARNMENFEQLEEVLDNRIFRRIKGETLTSRGSEGGGSRALGDVHRETFDERRGALAESVADVFSDQLLRWLFLFNFGPEVKPAKYVIESTPAEDLYKLAQRDQTLVFMGAQIPLSYVQLKYKIPEPKAGEEVLKPVKAPAGSDAAGDQAAARKPGGEFEETRDGARVPPDVRDGVEDVERLVDGAVKAAQQVYAPFLNRLIDAGAEAVKKKSR